MEELLKDKSVGKQIASSPDDREEVFLRPGYLKPKDFSEAGNAELFTKLYKERIRWTSSLGWMEWNGKQWIQNDESAKSLMIDFTGKQLEDAELLQDNEYIKHAKRMRSARSISGAVNLASSKMKIRAQVFDSDPYLLNTPSGIVDLKTGNLREHHPRNFCTKITACGFGNTTDEQRQIWKDFVDVIATDKETGIIDKDLELFLQKVIGASLIGKVLFEAVIFAVGSGRNGKSTFFNAISKVLNEYAGTIDINVLTTDRHNRGPAKATLRGKRFVVMSELDQGQRLSPQSLKQLASTDKLDAEAKFKAPDSFEPSHTLYMLTNHLPRVGSTEDGTWRRIVIVPFRNSIPPGEERPNYADTLFETAGSAILEWAVEGTRLFIEDGCRLILPESVIRETSHYRTQEDWLEDFLTNCCIVDKSDPSRKVRVKRLYDQYKLYCQECGIPYAQTMPQFNMALESKGFIKKTAGQHKTYWIGIDLKRDHIEYINEDIYEPYDPLVDDEVQIVQRLPVS